MRQLSLRIDDGLHGELRRAASEHELSVNQYLTRVLEAALTPGPDEPEIERIRARLIAAGLTSPLPPGALPRQAGGDDFLAARRRSAGGTPGSQIVASERGAR